MEYFDTRLFIDEIKKRPVIWDSASQEYKDRQLRTDTWTEVCVIFCPKYVEMSREEQHRIGKDFQTKWRNIRDAYIRNLRLQHRSKSNGAKPVKAYVFGRQLGFLKRVINFNFEEDPLATSQENTNDDEASTSETETSKYTARPSQCTVYLQEKSAVEEPANLHTDSFQQQGNRGNYLENEDMAFFTSLLPTLQTLRQEQKLKFRVDVMNLLLRYIESPSLRAGNRQNDQS